MATPRTLHLSRELPETTWPGERVPKASDAELAYHSLDASFISAFREKVINERNVEDQVEYLPPNTLNPLVEAEASDQPLQWPSFLFSPLAAGNFQPEGLAILVETCETAFLSKVCFFRETAAHARPVAPCPRYLTFAMACLGCLISGGHSSEIVDLWSTSLKLMIGSLEVDNREARKMELMEAWVLLETYGTLSSDPITWKQTSMAHGFVEAGLDRRLVRGSQSELDPSVHQSWPTSRTQSIFAYFVMIDLLRAIHFGQPAALATLAYGTPKRYSEWPPEHASSQDQDRLPPNYAAEDLWELICILAQIHTITVVFDPITTGKTSEGQESGFQASSPHIPYSPVHEIQTSKARLSTALQAWEASCRGKTDAHILLLFYFCRMYLSFPGILELPEIVGYQPRDGLQNKARQQKMMDELAADPRQRKEALPFAWLILETSSSIEGIQTVLWAPLAVFSAGLVVWANITMPGEGSLLGSCKVLDLFVLELSRMVWPCCQSMSAVLRKLQKPQPELIERFGEMNAEA